MTMEGFLQFATSAVKRNHRCIQLGRLPLLMLFKLMLSWGLTWPGE